MIFKNQPVTLATGAYVAVPADYSGATVQPDPNTLPPGCVVLNAAQPHLELAVRLLTGTSDPVAVLGHEVLVNAGPQSTGFSPEELIAQALKLRNALIEAGAPPNTVDSPGNVGLPTVMSYLTDPPKELASYASLLCHGNTGATEAYNGIMPADTRQQAMGHDGLYIVYLNDEADSAALTVAETRLNVLLGETPEFLHQFIDTASVIKGMTLFENGGRGGLLSVDGVESEISVESSIGIVQYYVYRKA